MCDPITASIALTAAGSVAQAAGQRRAQKAMDGAREAERIRQKGYQSQSDAALGESLANADKGTQDAQKGKAEGDRNAAYAEAVAATRAPVEATGDNLAGDTAGNTVVNTEMARQGAANLGFAGQQGGAKANLLSFNDVQLGNALYNARQLQEQARIGDAMRGSAGVLDLEMAAASRRGQGLQTLGSLLSAGGTIAGIGAGAGWFDKATTGDILAKGNLAMDVSKPATMNTIGNNLASYNKSLLPLDPFKLPVAPPSNFLGSGSFPATYKF